jgi:hypothetical protein
MGLGHTLALVLFAAAAAHAADEPTFWQQQFPNLQNPTADVRPKVRAHADRASIEALAEAYGDRTC